eukprot:TRINITY_DN6684_c0_g1_i1.p2 TRINITY_DN6684_c0_g1~~TRINITY_DN6684_c0_g1_i1.p2  ORF type:complete len:313 (-),score=78.04 TRINITY_DN6684_c0_g1_i1:1754-2692(-)
MTTLRSVKAPERFLFRDIWNADQSIPKALPSPKPKTTVDPSTLKISGGSDQTLLAKDLHTELHQLREAVQERDLQIAEQSARLNEQETTIIKLLRQLQTLQPEFQVSSLQFSASVNKPKPKPKEKPPATTAELQDKYTRLKQHSKQQLADKDAELQALKASQAHLVREMDTLVDCLQSHKLHALQTKEGERTRQQRQFEGQLLEKDSEFSKLQMDHKRFTTTQAAQLDRMTTEHADDLRRQREQFATRIRLLESRVSAYQERTSVLESEREDMLHQKDAAIKQLEADHVLQIQQLLRSQMPPGTVLDNVRPH